jgi:HTH-type transcriptional regulator/antitoxin HigA
MLKPIKTPRQHRSAIKRIDRLMDARAGTSEAAELEVQAILVER